MSDKLHKEILFLVFSLTMVGQSIHFAILFLSTNAASSPGQPYFDRGQRHRGIYRISGATVVYFGLKRSLNFLNCTYCKAAVDVLLKVLPLFTGCMKDNPTSKLTLLQGFFFPLYL